MDFANATIGKLDLDSMFAVWLMFRSPSGKEAIRVHYCSGTAPENELKDPRQACFEAGSLMNPEKDAAKNNFDEHVPAGSNMNLARPSSSRQVFARVIRMEEYVMQSDGSECGKYNFLEMSQMVHQKEYISLAQLISGLKLVVKEPAAVLENACSVFTAVLQTGIDPFGNMLPILDMIPGAWDWAKEKWRHEKGFGSVLSKSIWYKTRTGKKLAVIVSCKVGTPGKLYGLGADFVIALNPCMEVSGKRVGVRKFTVAGNGGLLVKNAIDALSQLESGWGYKDTGGIGGSPWENDSTLSLKQVVDTAIECL